MPLKPSRLYWFRSIAILLPSVLVALLELLLRGVGYGEDYSLFVEAPNQPDYRVMNPVASEKYFTVAENATLGNQELFRKQKGDNTFRIFVLGASTGLGYPYLHNGSFHRWLHYRLLHSVPDTDFEIINLSLTAVTTYTLLDFARQLVDYQPDAVLVYAGHNEYYGTLGVGSTSRLGSNITLVRTMIWLRDFRLMQLISNSVAKLRRSIRPPTDLRTNLMQRLAAEQSIPLGSELYERGVAQYTANLNDLLRVLNENKVPVLLSNLVSNEKDLPPLVSDSTGQETSASVWYQRAQRDYEAGNFAQAKTSFVRAKELDILRFRAPEAMNAAINALTQKYGNVQLVDAQAVFAVHSPHGILGQETLLEHVHPNLYGYALLSEAFYQGLRDQSFIPGLVSDALSLDELLRQMPVTQVDSLHGAYETMILKEGWPFNEPMPPLEDRQKTVEEALAGKLAVQQISWEDAMQQLLRDYVQAKNPTGAARVAEALVLEHPYQAAVYRQAGQLSVQANETTKAIRYLKKGFALTPSLDAAKELFVALLTIDRPDEALPYLDYAVKADSKFAELRSFTKNILRMKRAYAQDTTQTELLPQIAATYLRFANTTAARKYTEQALAARPGNPTALALQERLNRLSTQP